MPYLSQRKIHILLITILFSNHIICQIGIGFGKSFVYSERVVPMVGVGNKIFSNYPYLSLLLEAKLSKNISIQNMLFKHPGSTYFNFGKSYRDINNNNIRSFEMYNTDLYRNNLIIKYKIWRTRQNLGLHTMLGASYMTSFYRNYVYADYSTDLDGVPYKQNGKIGSKGYNISQWMPLLGLEFDLKIGKFNLFINAIATKGFKPVLKVYYPYTYYGIPQPTAISENRGTGIFTNIGIKTNWLQTKYEE